MGIQIYQVALQAQDLELLFKNYMAKSTAKNKLGVKNSLVNNINARKEKEIARPKKKSTVSKDAYNKMEDNWGKKKK